MEYLTWYTTLIDITYNLFCTTFIDIYLYYLLVQQLLIVF